MCLNNGLSVSPERSKNLPPILVLKKFERHNTGEIKAYYMRASFAPNENSFFGKTFIDKCPILRLTFEKNYKRKYRTGFHGYTSKDRSLDTKYCCHSGTFVLWAFCIFSEITAIGNQKYDDKRGSCAVGRKMEVVCEVNKKLLELFLTGKLTAKNIKRFAKKYSNSKCKF